MAEQSAFDLLHHGVQRQLWRMGWTQLRPLQVRSIQHIVGTDRDAILSAATAAGKTEAAFLPMLSRIADEPLGSVRALYVGPLKALINDQFARIEELCEHIEMPVHRWHGDVDAGAKSKLIRQPGGILLITPESLESLFVNRSNSLTSLFGGLRFVVIDELHSFLDNERGQHLQSLLSRLQRFVKSGRARLIGLSATIGEPEVAAQYLCRDHPERVELIVDDQTERELKLRIHAYQDPAVADEDEEPAALPQTDVKDDEEDAVVRDVADDIVQHCRGNANLIFANAKSDVEEYADSCKKIAMDQGLADLFLVHHGSLSAPIRQDTEETMKSGVAASTFCSSTLEMGIDIGSVRMVGQIGAPWSAASIKQRLGRSGRKENTPRILRMYIRCRNPGPTSSIFDRVHLELMQAIAVTELMLGDWVEPATPPACDLSTLIQQIISVIAESGSARADTLHRLLCAEGAFRDNEPKLFASLLRRLAMKDVVEQTPEGDLILGLLGERLRKDKGFYAVFTTADEYAVLWDGRSLGTLECAPEKDQHILFAGRRWKVQAVDHERLELHVKPARGRKRTRFAGGGGEVHPAIRAKMRQVLSTSEQYAYLDATATRLLSASREAAAGSRLCVDGFVPLGPSETSLMTWTGTRVQQTLRAMFEVGGITSRDEEISLVLPVASDNISQAIERCKEASEDPMLLARNVLPRIRRKYDGLLDEMLLDTSIARGWLDVDGALESLDTLRQCVPS